VQSVNSLQLFQNNGLGFHCNVCCEVFDKYEQSSENPSVDLLIWRMNALVVGILGSKLNE
jgi:hypothetical protein